VASYDWIACARDAYLKDAEDFLRARALIPSGESVASLLEKWPFHIRTSCKQDAPEGFSRQWYGAMGASNILTNIIDQFSRDYVVAALRPFFVAPHSFSGVILDFGCGAAAISLNWQWSFAPRARLLLADVENLPREFVRHEIAQHPECLAEIHDVSLDNVPDRSVDVMLCIDVLEHLSNPSEVFMLLHRKLRSGGLLFIQAPWGGHPEHVETALQDWESNGGGKLLELDYNCGSRMNDSIAVSGIYLKKLVD
jgi:SAM-dependent methyltransferase